MPPVGFEPTISAGERPQTYASDLAATGTGKIYIILQQILMLTDADLIHFDATNKYD